MIENVLIVDDQLFQIESARAQIASTLGAQVTAASSGKSAKALLINDEPFDLVLLDLNMPSFNGVEFLEYLRQIDFRGAIIIVSAAEKIIREAAAWLGKAHGLHVVGVIEKPLTIKKLVTTLAHA